MISIVSRYLDDFKFSKMNFTFSDKIKNKWNLTFILILPIYFLYIFPLNVYKQYLICGKHKTNIMCRPIYYTFRVCKSLELKILVNKYNLFSFWRNLHLSAVFWLHQPSITYVTEKSALKCHDGIQHCMIHISNLPMKTNNFIWWLVYLWK